MNLEVFENYANLNHLVHRLGIVAILLGGSVLYKHAELASVHTANDWDGIILVEQKTDITRLVNDHRRELCELLGVVREECPLLTVPDENTHEFSCIDVVRIVGYTSANVKKGAKIMSVEHLDRITAEDEPSPVNVLSFKDSRVITYQTQGCTQILRAYQATRLDTGLLILHDMDVFVSCGDRRAAAAIFGCDADLLVSGSWVYQTASCPGDRIARAMFAKLCRIHTVTLPPQIVCVFKNHSKFQARYRKAIEERLAGYVSHTPVKAHRTHNTKQQLVWWGDAPEPAVLDKLARPATQVFVEPRHVQSDTLVLYKGCTTPFSSNSTSGFCFPEYTGNVMFWKKTQYLGGELRGSELAVQHYPRTQQPLMVDFRTKVIFYPFFNGDLLAELRLECMRQDLASGAADPQLVTEILAAEMQRCEDTLRVYCSTAQMMDPETRLRPPIHRFFHDRIVQNRFAALYKNGIDLDDVHLDIEDIMSRSLVVNHCDCGSITQILERARDVLGAEEYQLAVCGMGDAHSGNVLVDRDAQQSGPKRILYVDYEVTGYHCPVLDMAKPFFTDVFFSTFYADLITPHNDLFAQGTVAVKLADGKIVIAFKLPKDLLGSAVFEMKSRYLLHPFLYFVERHTELELGEDWPSVFGHALFCCAVLARDFSARPDVFFANLALGAILSQMVGVDCLTNITSASRHATNSAVHDRSRVLGITGHLLN